MPPADELVTAEPAPTDWAKYALEYNGVKLNVVMIDVFTRREREKGYDGTWPMVQHFCQDELKRLRKTVQHVEAAPERHKGFRTPQSQAGRVTDVAVGRMRREMAREKRLTERQRAIVLEVFGKVQELTQKLWIDLGTREVGRGLGVSRQTAWRELKVLLALGILEQRPFDRRKFDKKSGRYNSPSYRYVPVKER